MVDPLPGDLYDYPVYYDLVFGSDWRAEYHFLLDCFETYAGRDVQHLFEPACGTGRLLYRLAKDEYDVSGLDLNGKAIDFCNKRLERNGFAPTTFVGDMADFKLPRRVDAAFNTINSFRHLSTEKQATQHLKCMASALKKGGLYILGLHLTPLAGETADEEAWSASRGHLTVNTRMWTVERDMKKRQERVRMTMNVYTPTKQQQWEDDILFRIYTWKQMQRLIAKVPEFEVTEIHDFAYNLDETVTLDDQTEDVVYILRKL